MSFKRLANLNDVLSFLFLIVNRYRVEHVAKLFTDVIDETSHRFGALEVHGVLDGICLRVHQVPHDAQKSDIITSTWLKNKR